MAWNKIDILPKSVSTVGQLWPRFIVAAKRSTSSTVLQASTPGYRINNSLMCSKNRAQAYRGRTVLPTVRFGVFAAYKGQIRPNPLFKF